MSAVGDKVISLAAEIAPCPTEDWHSDLSLVDDLGFDSITFLELVVSLESEFDIAPVSEPETRSIRTIGELMQLVEEKLNG